MNEETNLVRVQRMCVIRRARTGDCDAMADLAGQLGYECTVDEVRERLSDMQDTNRYAVFVAEIPGGHIAGWIGAYLFRSVETASRVEINGLVVDRDMRSRGIGKMLIGAAEQWARSIRCSAVSVRSNIRRDRAHRFYGINGYGYVKTQKEFRKSL